MSLQVIPELASCLENWSAGVRVPRQRLRCVGGVVRMRGVRHMQAVVRRFRLDVGVHGIFVGLGKNGTRVAGRRNY